MIAIIGLGLIGGSLLQAAQAANLSAVGYDSDPETLSLARSAGFHVAESLSECFDADVIVLAVPLPQIDELFGEIAQHSSTAQITDVASVKGQVHLLAEHHGLTDRYVGGHPMAGTDQSGWDAAYPTLFRSKAWALTTTPKSPSPHPMLVYLIARAGSRIVPLSPEEHDSAVGLSSHVPHIFAEALASLVAKHPVALELAAGSFKDGTRVARTQESLVRNMCEGNAEPLADALDETIKALSEVRDRLKNGENIADFIHQGHEGRILWEKKHDIPTD